MAFVITSLGRRRGCFGFGIGFGVGFLDLPARIFHKIIAQQVLRPPNGVGDRVDAEEGCPVVHVTQHPQVVFIVVHPIANILCGEWLLVGWVIGMARSQTGQ